CGSVGQFRLPPLHGNPKFPARCSAIDIHPPHGRRVCRIWVRAIPVPGRDYVFLSVVLLMAVPQQMVAVPIFKLMLCVGLLNPFLGLILLRSAWGIPWIVLFMRNFYRTLPVEIVEAGRVDGASVYRSFFGRD